MKRRSPRRLRAFIPLVASTALLIGVFQPIQSAFASTSVSGPTTVSTCRNIATGVVSLVPKSGCPTGTELVTWSSGNTYITADRPYMATLIACMNAVGGLRLVTDQILCLSSEKALRYTRTWGVPSPPVIRVAQATGMTSAMVVYTDPASNNGSLITQYRVTLNPDGIVTYVKGPGSPTVFVNSLTADTEYTFTVCAQNAAGWSSICPTSLPFRTYPLPPAFTLIPISETEIYGSAITGYSISSTGGKIDSFSISPSAPAGLTFDPVTGLLSGTPVTVQAPTVYTITGTNKSGSASATFTLTINQAVPTFSWADVSKVATAPDWTLAPPTSLTPGSWVYVSGDTGVITLSGAVAHIVSAGTSLITATFTPTDTVNYVSGGTIAMTITVTKDSQVITFDPLSGKTYGDAPFTLSGSASSGLPVTFSSDTPLVCTTTGTNGEDVTVLKVGTCSITATQGGNEFYFPAADVTRTFAVGQKALTVTADSKTKVYGNDDPELTYVAVGLVGGDSLTGALDRAAGENVGTYAIGQGTLANANYDITFVPADLTITARSITVTADAKSKIYGQADPTLTYAITSGSLVGTDTLSGALSRATGEDVGVYAITQGSLAASSNYALTFVGANLTITAKALTVTADAKSKVYGSADPELTYVAVGLVGGDSLTGALSRASGENVGTYAIGQGTLANANYDITYVPAHLTITKATPIFSWADVSKLSTDPDWVLTAPTSSTPGTFSYVSGNVGVITMSSSTAHIVGAGTSLMTATFTPTDAINYVSGGTVTMTITVIPGAVAPTLSWDCSRAGGAEQYFDGNEFKLCRVVAPVPGSTVYTSSDTSVFTVTGSGGGQVGHPEMIADAYLIGTFTPEDLVHYLVTTIQLTVHITGGSHPHWWGWQEP